MIITDLIDFNKKRVKVFIDEEFAFVLYKGELNLYGIKVGEELLQGNLEEIVNVVLMKRARLRAANLLIKKEYTQKQLTDKLFEGGYPNQCIEAAVMLMKKHHYIDDKRFTESYLRNRVMHKSKKQLTMELLGKGIAKDLINEVLEESDINNDSEENTARNLLNKKKFNSAEATYEEKQKISAYLFRKGFSTEIIRKVINCSQFDE